jgi:integrase
VYVANYDDNMAIEFMQHIYLNNKISERVYNNYVTFYRLFFNWCIQYKYCSKNPFEKITKKKEKQKTRIMIDPETRTKLKDYLYKNDFEYFVVCMFAYYGFIRPKEIAYLKIKHIDLHNRIINIPSEISKSCKSRIATIPDQLSEYIKMLNLNRYNKEYFVFSRNFKPGPNLIDLKAIGRKWIILRDILNIQRKCSSIL